MPIKGKMTTAAMNGLFHSLLDPLTRVERVHHGDGPPTRRRISQPQQAMRLLST